MVTLIEEWRPIPGCVGYEASSLGRIRSLDRMSHIVRKDGIIYDRLERGTILKQTKTTQGYMQVGIGGKSLRVNVLIALTFRGPCPDGRVVAHDDGSRDNNNISNLIYKTFQENSEDMIRHGTKKIGSALTQSVIKEDIAALIRSLYAEGTRQIDLADMFGIHQSTVSQIVRKVTWRHVI